jgi:histidinol-phosphatase (PHP family)
MIVDYHVHLRDEQGRIAHTVEAVERFVEVARARGVDEIGFSEHVYYFRQTREVWTLPYQTERCVYDLDAYCQAVLEGKRRGLPVKLALEVDYVGDRQGRLGELLAPYPWDYLLGSVHWLDGLAVDQAPGAWAQWSPEEVWRRYVECVGDLAASGAVDVLAHLDLAKIFGRRPAPPLLAELHRRLAETAAAAGVAVEVSTAGLRKPVGEIYPDPALLRACAERGVAITTASDAHEPATVGTDLDRALSVAREAGYARVAVFQGRRMRREPLG